ncbi:MAG: biotin--[acetyl-CoA-carboxylase] ligase [Pirellulaceae bacterium]|nr:biotin--[acetyl-CoA-carboxylase] ligase [Pirellulaceae bacterium]
MADDRFSADDLSDLRTALPDWIDVQHAASIPSTNSWAMDAAGECETARLFLADNQTAGRGRGANAWWSTAGSLTFSLLVNTDFVGIPERRWPLASLAAGLAISQAISNHVPGASLAVKWPNDVFWNGRKVSGVLVETSGASLRRMVIGVGVNVNNSLAAAPLELQGRATAACDEAGRRLDRVAILSQIVLTLAARLQQVGADADSVLADLRAVCFLTGRRVVVDAAGGRVAGACRGIGEDGALLVEHEGGVRELLAGVVVEIGD